MMTNDDDHMTRKLALKKTVKLIKLTSKKYTSSSRIKLVTKLQANIYLFKVNNRSTRKRC